MKKFWTLLALLALALNFSSASLWAAEEKKEDSVLAVTTQEVAKDGNDEETALEATAVAKDESIIATEEKTDAIAKPADSTVKTEAVAVVGEEKKTDDMNAVLPETVQSEEKVS